MKVSRLSRSQAAQKAMELALNYIAKGNESKIARVLPDSQKADHDARKAPRFWVAIVKWEPSGWTLDGAESFLEIDLETETVTSKSFDERY